MKKIYKLGTALAVTSGLLTSCGGHETDSKKSVIDQAVVDYTKEYGCPVPVEIISGDNTENSDPRVNSLATGEPGKIILDSEDWVQMSEKEQRDTIIHEMTHACQKKELNPLDPYRLIDGSILIAARGLSAYVERPDGTNTFFTKIEEGAAEALAYKLDRSYAVQDPSYFAIGKLTLQLMDDYNITPTELAEYVQGNDLLGYVGAIYGKDEITGFEVEEIISLYNETYVNAKS